MHSLFDVLSAQHARQLTPVRCAHSTIAQLHRYFEDVVLESNLNALVIESLPLAAKRSPRELARVRELTRGGRRTFFFASQHDDINNFIETADFSKSIAPIVLHTSAREHANEHFVVIADARFSALLATVRTGNDADSHEDEVVWTFEPDIVYSALEYLMARVRAEHPDHASIFGTGVRTSMPKATSLQLTLGVTTKLAHLLQAQAAREIAVNRIATTIRESLELGVILQKTVSEVGAALNVAGCALRVEGRGGREPLLYSYFAGGEEGAKLERDEVISELNEITSLMSQDRELFTREDADGSESQSAQFPLAVVPLVFQEQFVGALEVIDDDRARTWQDNEILLLLTVANQVAAAIVHAELFAQTQKQALTDALTGVYNRRSFEMELDRELQVAVRQNQPLALIMLDLDHFKLLNDSAGHDAGDEALCKLAACFRQELRAVDTAARFGGDEFVLILPQAYVDGAVIVAERLRTAIEKIETPGGGHLAASIGIATFPASAATRSGLVTAADNALYHAKRTGRNRVSVFDGGDRDATATMLPGSHASSEPLEHRM